jgi:hypothetical protein
MKKNDIFKLGISIGEMQNQETFKTGTKHPEIAIAQANSFMNSKYGPGFNIYFVDDKKPSRRRRRRNG